MTIVYKHMDGEVQPSSLLLYQNFSLTEILSEYYCHKLIKYIYVLDKHRPC